MQHTGARFRCLVIAPFLVAVTVLAALGVTSAEILSAARAYVAGESLWSKAQKDAVYHLTNYADSHSPSDYQRFVDSVKVPLGDQEARVELGRPNPDLSVARRGFVAGGNHPDDVDAMIRLFRVSRYIPLMDRAITIWAEADEHTAELILLAEQMHRHVQAGDANLPRLRVARERLSPLNDQLTSFEQRLSAALGESSRTAQRLVQFATLLLALALAAAAVLFSSSLPTFDLVVSDFNMPRFSGLDLAREVIRIRADLPVVITSGQVTEEQRAELFGAGVRDLLQKENTFEELGPLVHRLMQDAEKPLCAIA